MQQTMLSVVEAQQRIIAAVAPLPAETIALDQAHGRVLAVDARAAFDQPPAPMSAMDGYAVRSQDSGIRRVIGAAPAGHPFKGTVGPGQAVRIFTGGVVPDGADAIMLQEDARLDGDQVQFSEVPRPGRSIRAAGLDFHAGTVLARAGQRLGARHLALLAAGDAATVSVRRKPLVAFAATGDELIRPGAPRAPGAVAASSGYGLSAMIEGWGGVARDLGILPDNAEALATLPALAEGADLVLTLGGASVGDHDLVRTIPGLKLDFWKIAMRPGKPLVFGGLGTIPLIGLPGNPVSALVTALLFVRPAIAAMLGADTALPPRQARLAAPLAANDSRQDYLRARFSWRHGECWAEAFAVQDSSMLKLFAESGALIVRPPHAPAADTGTMVEIIPLQQ